MTNIYGFPSVPAPRYPGAPQTAQQQDLLKMLLSPQNLLSLALTGKLPDSSGGGVLNSLIQRRLGISPAGPTSGVTTPAVPVIPVTRQPLPAIPGASTRDISARSPWGASAPTSFSEPAGIDQAYVNQLTKGEGFSATPYRDGSQMSIGYGTRWLPGQPANISQATGQALMRTELNDAFNTVRKIQLPNGVTMSPSQTHALADLTYNAGPGWTKGAIGNAVRQGNFDKAADLISNWPKTPGRGYATTTNQTYMPGLQARRDWTANLLRQANPATATTLPVSPAVPATSRSILPTAPILNAQPIQPNVVTTQPTTLDEAFPGATLPITGGW